ncbi:MAG: hypothetical protein LBQ75_01535 [Zoogloeaceae bacterium]|jgi:hypothetical protein|nr:hypothetical protein [Zoogloeaceae bacterium]
MNARRSSPDSFDDLPVLTEVVVPSPILKPEAKPEERLEEEEETSDLSATLAHAPEDPESLPPELQQTVSNPEPELELEPDDVDTDENEDEDEAEDEDEDEDEETPDSDFPTEYADIREALIEAVQKRISAEIPTLVEASLQNSLPMIMLDIQEGLEESANMALKDLIVSLREKSPPKKR